MTDKLRLIPPPSTLPAGSTVWAYLRDSGGPTQSFSVQQQREMLFEYCAQYGLRLTHPPFEDTHKTGTTTNNRNEFDYLMKLSSGDELPTGLLIWNFARFSRGGIIDAQFYKSTLRKRGLIIHSLTDKIPEGEFAPIVETLIDLANKQKADEAAMGAWRGLRFLVKQGAVPGNPPVGFIRTPIKTISEDGTERTAHRRDPDPDFKLRINKAFRMKAQGKSLGEIHAETKLFNSINSYVTFFRNPLYIGTLHFGDMIVEGYCKPTVPKKLWEKVQAIMDAAEGRKHLNSKTNHPRRVASIYLLSSVLKCARCGGAMNGKTTKQPYGDDYRQYTCTTAKIKKTCAIKPIPAKFIEKLVLDGIHQFFDDPQNLINVMTAWQATQSNRQKHVDEERASINAQLSALRKKLTNITNVLSEKPNSPTLLKKLTALEEDENILLSKIGQLDAQTSAPIIIPTTEQARVAARKIQEDLKSNEPAKVRQILLGIIEQIKVDRQGKHLVANVTYYHIPTVKKKNSGVKSTRASTENYAYISDPRGGTQYRRTLDLTVSIKQGRLFKTPR